MPTIGTITFEDYDHEIATTSVNLADIGSVGATYDTETQNLDEVKDALILVSLAAVRKTQITKAFPESAAVVTDLNAQRERKWLVTYQDNKQFLDVGNTVANPGYLKKYNMEIPGAKVVGLLSPEDKKSMILSAGDGATLKASLEANVRSPTGGTITVLAVTLVGRNT